MNLAKLISKSLILFALMTTYAHAQVPSNFQVYTTWGGFDIISNTFQRIALMMSDNSYKGFFFAFAASSFAFSIIMAFAKAGTNNPHGAWIRVGFTMVVGAMIYTAFITKTSDLVVYDESYNKTKRITGLPDGLILLAVTINKIEKAIVDTIWTSGDPASYRDSGAGSIFDLIKNTFSTGVNLAGTSGGGEYIKQSIKRYTEDCILYEISRPGSAINLNSFNTTNDFRGIFNSASNLSVYTQWYDEANKAGECVSCATANTNLNNYFGTLTETSDVVERFYTEKCGKGGLAEVTGSTGLSITAGCKAKIRDFIGNKILASSVTSSQIVMQSLIAKEIWNLVNEGKASELGNRQAGLNLSGMGMMSNEWIPIIKNTTFAMFIGLFPFLALFIPTPLFQKSLSFIFGSFIFLTSWGICDALMHSFAMDKALVIFREIQNGGLGLRSILLFADESSKALAIFGAARWSSMIVASALTAILVQFGGAIAGQFAGQFSSISNSGSGALNSTQDPTQKASTLSALESSVPSQTVSNSYGFETLSGVNLFNKDRAVRGSTQTIEQLGGTPLSASSNTATADAFNTVQTAKTASGIINSVGSGNLGIASDKTAKTRIFSEDKAVKSTEGIIASSIGDGSLSTASSNLSKNEILKSIHDTKERKMSVDELGKGNTEHTADRTATASVQEKAIGVKTSEKVRDELGGMSAATNQVSDANAFKAQTNIEEAKQTKEILGPDAAQKIGSTAAINSVKAHAYTDSIGADGAQFIGSVSGNYDKATTQGNADFIKTHGTDAVSRNTEQGQERSLAFNDSRSMIAEVLNGKPISPATINNLKTLTETDRGRQYLSEALKGVAISNVTPEQAPILQALVRKSDPERFKDYTVNTGESIVMDMGYNPSTNSISVSNIDKKHRADSSTGSSSSIDINTNNVRTGNRIDAGNPVDDVILNMNKNDIDGAVKSKYNAEIGSSVHQIAFTPSGWFKVGANTLLDEKNKETINKAADKIISPIVEMNSNFEKILDDKLTPILDR